MELTGTEGGLLIYSVFRGELFKVVRRPGIWVLISVLLVLAILIGYAITWLIYTYPPPGSNQGLPPGTTLADFKVALYRRTSSGRRSAKWGVLGGVFALIVGCSCRAARPGAGGRHPRRTSATDHHCHDHSRRATSRTGIVNRPSRWRVQRLDGAPPIAACMSTPTIRANTAAEDSPLAERLPDEVRGYSATLKSASVVPGGRP